MNSYVIAVYGLAAVIAMGVAAHTLLKARHWRQRLEAAEKDQDA